MERIFEWDDKKAEINLKKHKVSFQQASKVFSDPFALSRQDRNVDGEDRWQTMGMVEGCVLLLVAHTVRFEDVEIIRIISARHVTRQERKQYEFGTF